MSDLISKEDLLTGIYNDAPKDVMKYIAEFPTVELCGDLISRQDAIDAVAEELIRISNIHVQNVSIARIKDKLKALPSAQKKGEWINNVNGTFECSICGWKHSRNNFCPNCGADMRGEGNK